MIHLNTKIIEREFEYVRAVISHNPTMSGWFHNENDDWFYIVNSDKNVESKLYRNEAANLFDTYYLFNNNSKAIKAFARIDSEKPIVSLINSVGAFDITPAEEMTVEKLLSGTWYYFDGHDGLVINKTIKLKLADGIEHTYVADVRGRGWTELMYENRLSFNGIIADKYMYITPYKKFGTVMRGDTSYLCSPTGIVLNVKKKKLSEGDVYCYVNSDKTFFYSSDSDDSKWY